MAAGGDQLGVSAVFDEPAGAAGGVQRPARWQLVEDLVNEWFLDVDERVPRIVVVLSPGVVALPRPRGDRAYVRTRPLPQLPARSDQALDLAEPLQDEGGIVILDDLGA